MAYELIWSMPAPLALPPDFGAAIGHALAFFGEAAGDEAAEVEDFGRLGPGGLAS